MQAATDFWVYFSIIRKRLWLTILLFLVTIGVILSVSYTAKPVYQASVRLQVLATDSLDVSLFDVYKTTSSAAEIQQAQNDFMRALKSGFVAWQTIADLNLEIGALDLLDGLATATEGEFIQVTVTSDDPGRAEAIASTQVNNALEYYRDVRATPSRVLREFVSEQLGANQVEIEAAEQALLAFKQQNGLDSIDLEMRSLQDVLRTLKLDRDRALMEKDRASIFAKTYREQELVATQKADELDALRLAAAEVLEAEEEAETGSESAVVAEEEASFAPSTIKYWRDLALQHEATAISYEATRDGYARSIEIYNEMILQRDEELKGLLKLNDDQTKLERSQARAQSNANFLWDKENEARLKQLQAEKLGYIQITEPARKPDAPVPSKTLQLVVVGAVVSILAGFVLSFLIEFLALVRKAGRRQRVS